MNKKYKDFFNKLTGFDPYSFQESCADEFLDHNSFILNAPTGSGKTWASITPFIFSWSNWKKENEEIGSFPRKLIYSLPLRTLANSLYKEVKEKIESKFPKLNLSITLQTGEHANDPLFEGDIIFTTIDQTLGNILSIPLSLSKNMANINAGAVLSSYLVFDEIHLLDSLKSLNTVIAILYKLKSIIPFCLMTATLSKKFMKQTGSYLDANIVSVSEDDYSRFSYVKEKAERFVTTSKLSLDADQIIKHHKNKSIVICNTVDKCTSLYKEILNKENKPSIVICLHSRFFGSDRKRKEEDILNYFGKKSKAESVLLITTQVVEVGLDISCDVMLTEVSPINSFLQRIGRCVRWKGKGNIHVFDCEETYLPYKKEISQNTLTELSKLNQQHLDYFKSQELIEKILSDDEQIIFDEIINDREIRKEQISNSWKTGDKGFSRDLIRDIRSISIVLLPKGFKTKSLYTYEAISLNPYSLKKKIDEYIDENGQEEPFLLALEENFIFDDDFNSEEKELKATDYDSILTENIVALNSEVIGYSSDFGLDFENCSDKVSNQVIHSVKDNYIIHYDTFSEHIAWMSKSLSSLKDFHFALNRIQQTKYQNYDLYKAIDLMICLHDYGKLNEKWQEIVRMYQEEKSRSKVEDFLAHTDFDPDNETDKEIMDKLRKKPNHAGIGAFAIYQILPILFKLDRKSKEAVSFCKVFATAVLRHHSSFATTIPSYTIKDTAYNCFISEIEKISEGFSIKELCKLPLQNFKGEKLDKLSISFDKDKDTETFLYFILVRILRLCDQYSFNFNPRTGVNK